MARGLGNSSPVMDDKTTAKADRATAKTEHRHAGPYGASFDGTDRDGKTPVRGLTFERRWTRPDVHPYDEITWEYRTAGIANESGKTVFEQKDVEVPDFWSQLATNVVVSKYFRGHLGTPERETSVRQLIDRVVNTITAWAETQHYFATDADLQTFKAELTHLLVHQKMAFNSPVWFNVGIEAEAAVQRLLHQLGRRTRCPRSWTSPRPRRCCSSSARAPAATSPPSAPPSEKMAGGGTASGPVCFMKGYDAFAGVVKSGGKTRRAAKMVILDAGHPDVLEFIDSKAHEEQKAWALIEAGYDPSFTGEAYGSVFFQNANHTVRVTDAFMQAVVDDGEWTTHAVVAPHEADGHLQGPRRLPQDGRGRPPLRRPGHPVRHDHQRLAHLGEHGPDPRVQPVLRVHVPQRHRVQPGRLNLMKFVGADGEFDVEAYRFAAKVTLTAQEILVDNARYPTPRIEENSHKFRPLGLGYANLGALLMSRGLAYDSDEGRNYAAALTAIMHGEAYKQSAIIARDHGGPFVTYDENREPFLRVIDKHRDAAYQIPADQASRRT